MKVHLSNVEKTLLIALWGRAESSRGHNPLLNDSKAIEIIEQIDYLLRLGKIFICAKVPGLEK